MPNALPQPDTAASVSALVSGLIHEIKNPLNTLSLNLQLLAEDWQKAETAEERRALKRIQLLQTEVNRLTLMLNGFVDFVRGHRLVLAQASLNKLVEDVLTFLQPEFNSRRIEVRKSLGALPPCRLDANLIKQALLNLLLNAEQAMEHSETREVIVRTAAHEGGVRLDVIDTGCGITPENMGKLFQVFFSTRKGGSGLGLATSRRIVEEHGGRLEAHSEAGRGSCFIMTLPLEPPPNGNHVAASSADAGPEGRNA